MGIMVKTKVEYDRLSGIVDSDSEVNDRFRRQLLLEAVWRWWFFLARNSAPERSYSLARTGMCIRYVRTYLTD